MEKSKTKQNKMGTYEGNEGKKAKEMEKKYTRGEIKVKKGV